MTRFARIVVWSLSSPVRTAARRWTWATMSAHIVAKRFAPNVVLAWTTTRPNARAAIRASSCSVRTARPLWWPARNPVPNAASALNCHALTAANRSSWARITARIVAAICVPSAAAVWQRTTSNVQTAGRSSDLFAPCAPLKYHPATPRAATAEQSWTRACLPWRVGRRLCTWLLPRCCQARRRPASQLPSHRLSGRW